MYKGTLCVLIVVTVISSTSALPLTSTRKVRGASDTVTLTSKFECLIKNLNEIKKNVSSVETDKFTIILKEFNFTCRTFTFIMMLKLQLQDYLFQMAEDSEITDILHKLTHLETAAAILNDIAVRSSQQPCVVFGPDGYEHIYNDTLAKNMISDDQEGESGKINKLLHRMLDDAGQVLDLIIFTLS